MRGPPPRISTEDTAQIAWASCPVALHGLRVVPPWADDHERLTPGCWRVADPACSAPPSRFALRLVPATAHAPTASPSASRGRSERRARAASAMLVENRTQCGM